MTDTHYVGKGTVLDGKLDFEDSVRIDGTIRGQIRARGDLVVGSGGKLEADVHGTVVVVEGVVQGSLQASERVEIRSTGQVYGTLATPSLAVEVGAIYEGECKMKGGGRPAAGRPSAGAAPA